MATIFKDNYQQLRILVGETEISTKTLHIALRFSMEIVEFSELKGSERKVAVRELLKKLINDVADGNETCLQLLDSDYFDQSIDLIVEASKGGLSLNRLRQTSSGLAKLLGCLCK
jgi:hypothetical protein